MNIKLILLYKPRSNRVNRIRTLYNFDHQLYYYAFHQSAILLYYYMLHLRAFISTVYCKYTGKLNDDNARSMHSDETMEKNKI